MKQEDLVEKAIPCMLIDEFYDGVYQIEFFSSTKPDTRNLYEGLNTEIPKEENVFYVPIGEIKKNSAGGEDFWLVRVYVDRELYNGQRDNSTVRVRINGCSPAGPAHKVVYYADVSRGEVVDFQL